MRAIIYIRILHKDVNASIHYFVTCLEMTYMKLKIRPTMS
jgi:hypothetical protein